MHKVEASGRDSLLRSLGTKGHSFSWSSLNRFLLLSYIRLMKEGNMRETFRQYYTYMYGVPITKILLKNLEILA